MMEDIPDESRKHVEEHYKTEKALAAKLRGASKKARRHLYARVYDELFSELPHHPQLERSHDQRRIDAQLAVLKKFVKGKTNFLEVGAGDCKVAQEVAKLVEHAYAVEVSRKITGATVDNPHFHLVLSDGIDLPVAKESIDVAYSYQVMEHIHPEDAVDQLKNLWAVLTPGGRYLCVTPNRLNGPWDISRGFDDRATGLHLKEYTNVELANLLKSAGFRKVRVYIRAKGLHLQLPILPIALLERVLSWLPRRSRRALAGWYPLKRVLGVNIIGVK